MDSSSASLLCSCNRHGKSPFAAHANGGGTPPRGAVVSELKPSDGNPEAGYYPLRESTSATDAFQATDQVNANELITTNHLNQTKLRHHFSLQVRIHRTGATKIMRAVKYRSQQPHFHGLQFWAFE